MISQEQYPTDFGHLPIYPYVRTSVLEAGTPGVYRVTQESCDIAPNPELRSSTCSYCLPPHSTTTFSSATMMTTSLSVRSLSRRTVTTCTSINSLAPTPACTHQPFEGIMICNRCPTDQDGLEACPYLCEIRSLSTPPFCQRSDINGETPISGFGPANCTRCLPPCAKSAFGSPTSTKQSFVLPFANSTPSGMPQTISQPPFVLSSAHTHP